jgi:hypothetical protein
MALKPQRIHYGSDISYFATSTAERGGIVSVVTAGSGAAMDQALNVAGYRTNSTLLQANGVNGSGFAPIGVLMDDVVNLDLTRQHKNFHKQEVQVGGKVSIWDDCEVVTNMLIPGITVTAGQPAFLGASGLITNVDLGAIASPIVGMFRSTKNEEGFAKVRIRLPQSRS